MDHVLCSYVVTTQHCGAMQVQMTECFLCFDLQPHFLASKIIGTYF